MAVRLTHRYRCLAGLVSSYREGISIQVMQVHTSTI